MKNKIYFFLSFVFCLSVNAQIYTPSGIIQGTTTTDNNIGIGTSNARTKLTIQAGPDGYPTPLKAISIIGPNSPENANSAQDLSWDFAAAGSSAIRSYRGGNFDTYLQFMTNSEFGGNAPQVRMHIGGDGNVGIGTANPDAKLVVNGEAKVKQNLFISGASGGYTTGDNPVLYFGINSEFAKINIPFGDKMNFSSYHGYTFNTSNNGSTAIPALTIGITGNVGVGTTNPDSKLTVAGNIHAQEVKITASAGTVPDYVFANDYKLKTLQEVEAYIKQNRHLPEIPSAKEIEKNGLMLAEMNMSLLKKIEELTLYSIEQNKKIEAQSKEIKNQSKEIENLKDLVLHVTKIEKELAKK